MSILEMKAEIQGLKVKLATANQGSIEFLELTIALMELQGSLIYKLEQLQVSYSKVA